MGHAKILQTSRLRLTPCRLSDCADFMSLESDPQVMFFLNGGFAVDHSISQPEANFLMPRGTEDDVWTARHRNTNDFVGWFCLWPESVGVAELGYRLRRSEWGQGLATEGASALIAWGFGNAGYSKIISCTMTANQGSRRVMEKCGLKYSHENPVNWAEAIPGGEQGEVHYAIDRKDWLNRPRT